MAENNSQLSKFESLWQEAIDQKEELQVAEIKNIDTDIQLISLLQRLSKLADILNDSNVIDSSQYDQMQMAVANLKEVIEKIDPAALAKAQESVN